MSHRFNDSSDSFNNNNAVSSFPLVDRIPVSSDTSSSDSNAYWPDHLSKGPAIRRGGGGGAEEESSTTDSQNLDSEEDDDDSEKDEAEVKEVLEVNQDDTILPSRTTRRRTTISTSKPTTTQANRASSNSPNAFGTFNSPLPRKDSVPRISSTSHARRMSPRGGINSEIVTEDSIGLSSESRGQRERLRDGKDTKRDYKGKGREREHRTSYKNMTPLENDPLDPLASLRHAPFQSTYHHQQSDSRDLHILDKVPSTNLASSSNSIASQPSQISTSAPSAPPPPQSLQQLLQTVDLSAALLLVQTLQKNQLSNSKPVPSPQMIVPSTNSDSSSYLPQQHERDRTGSSTYFSSQHNAMSISSTDTHTPLLPPAQISPPRSPLKNAHLRIDEPSLRARSSTLASVGTSSGGGTGSTTDKKETRRRSLSLGFGSGNVVKKLRVSSGMLSGGKEAFPKVKERILDERANLGEQGRDFEDQISRVHLSLSPATMRRAQYCTKYFSLRYTSLYSALSTPGSPLPNPLAVSRWRIEMEEAERRQRRAQLGISGRTKIFGSTGGGKEEGDLDSSTRSTGVRSITGSIRGLRSSIGSLSITPAYGPRRNKHPKAWELYPDEIEEYLETGGKVPPPEIESNEFGRAITSRSTSINSTSNSPLVGTSNHPRSITSGSPNRTNNVSLPFGSPLSRSTTGRSSVPSLRSSVQSTSGGTSFQFPPPQPSTSSIHKPPLSTIESDSRTKPPSVIELATSLPSSPRHLIKVNHGNHTPTSSTVSLHKHSEGGLRNTLSRRFDKIRGKGLDLDHSNHTVSDIGEGISTIRIDPSESELNLNSTVNGNGFRAPSISELGGGNSNLSFRRGKLRRTDTSKGEIGYRSSGGEESGGTANGKKRLSTSTKGTRWPQKWRGKIVGGEMVSVEEGVELGMRRRKVLRAEESEEEDEIPREVLDLGDEEFIKLNTVLREARVQISHVDTFLPRIPAQLIQYLDLITQHDTTTFKTLNIPVQYSYPRLTASVISQLANRKVQETHPITNTPSTISDRTATTTDPETSSSSSSSSDDDKEKESSTIRFDTPRRNSQIQVRHVSGGHARRVTDPISKGLPTGRARSQTLALPSGHTGLGGGGSAIRGLTHPSGMRVDRIALLEKAIGDLEKTKKEVEEDISSTMDYQEKIRIEINQLILPVDRISEVISTTYDPRLQTVEKHYFRLNTSRVKTEYSIDFLWGLLSYVIASVLWAYWLIATIIYFVCLIAKSPFLLIRSIIRFVLFL